MIKAGCDEDEALAVLRPPGPGAKAIANVLFIGVAVVGMSHKPSIDGDNREVLPNEVIAAFRCMLVCRPDLICVRLELTRHHFEHVLTGKPLAGVALNVNRFLAQIRAHKRSTYAST